MLHLHMIIYISCFDAVNEVNLGLLDIMFDDFSAHNKMIRAFDFAYRTIFLQVVNQYSRRSPIPTMTPSSIYQIDDKKYGDGSITIGEALEAAALTAGQKPIEWSDAAAIQAAEVRATGRTSIVPGGVAAAAQSAAHLNARTPRDEDKTTLADILGV